MITAWSSGTGSAGIIGSVSWASLIALGISPRTVLRTMLIIPLIQGTTFWLILRSPQNQKPESIEKTIDIATIESNGNTIDFIQPFEVKLSGLKAKLKFIPKLINFIAPLVIVFVFEYICVSGLVNTIINIIDLS